MTKWSKWHLGSSMTDMDLPVLNMSRNIMRNIILAKSYASLIFLKQIENKKKCK